MRDCRIDFFRGLSIYMIFIDHVSGDPLAKFTYQSLGFSDAAEIFVFLSGLACGIAYSRALARKGWRALIATVARRAGRIYFYYVLSSIAIILIAAAANLQGIREPVGMPADHPVTAIWSALSLLSPPPISGFLVLYIALTLFVVPTLLIAGDRHCLLALAVSGLTWAGAQIFADTLAPLTHRWYPNLFAWQFLFAIGLVVGMKWDSKRPVLPLLSQTRWVMVAAWTIVIGAFFYRLLSARSGFDVAWLRPPPGTWSSMKANLCFIRLAHFLSVTLLVAVYFRRDSPLLQWPIVRPVIKTGMYSLELFSLAVVLDVIVNIVVLTCFPSLLDRFLMDSIAILLLALTAIALANRRAMV